MTYKDAAEFLVSEGYFKMREDGWFYAEKPPKKGDLDYYVLALHQLSAWSTGNNPPVRVTRGGDPYSLMWKLER